MPRLTASRCASQRRDRIARWVIMLGGIAVIASVIAILLLIVGVTLPLFRARARRRRWPAWPCRPNCRRTTCSASGIDLAIGQDTADGPCPDRGTGRFTFLDLADRRSPRPTAPAPRRAAAAGKARGRASSSTAVRGTRCSGPTARCRWSKSARRRTSDEQGRRQTQYSLQELGRRAAPARSGAQPRPGPRRPSRARPRRVRLLPDGRVAAAREVVTENLLGEKETTSQALAVDTAGLAPITALTMDRDGTTLYVGTATGQLGRWQFDDEGETRTREIITAFRDGGAITALAMVFGDVSLAVGDATGELTTWFPVRYDEKPRLTQVHTLTPHAGAVRDDPAFAAAQEPAEPGRRRDAAPGPHDQRAAPGCRCASRRRCGTSACRARGDAVIALERPGRTGGLAGRRAAPGSQSGRRCSARCTTRATTSRATRGRPPAATTSSRS